MTNSNPIPTKQETLLPQTTYKNKRTATDDERFRLNTELNTYLFNNCDHEHDGYPNHLACRPCVLDCLAVIAARAADGAPRTDRALISELIHIAAELARGEGFLPTCAEDMNPRLKRADILKTAERQDLQLKDWANRVKQVVDKLSAAAPASPTGAESELSLRFIATESVANKARAFCEELQEDAEGVPQLQLSELHTALDAWEAYPDARASFDDSEPVLAALASLVEDEHATDHQRRVARLALTAILKM